MPALNYRNEEFWAGVLAHGISANGEIIYGTSWENDDCGMLYWKNNGTTVEEPKWVGDDIRRLTPVIVEDWMGEYEYNLVDGCICTAETTKVSPSGKWIATTYRKEEVGSDGFIAYVQRPAFYNTETETTTVVEDYGEATACTSPTTASPSSASARCSSPRVKFTTSTRVPTWATWQTGSPRITVSSFREASSNTYRQTADTIFGTSVNALGNGFDDWYIAPPLQ